MSDTHIDLQINLGGLPSQMQRVLKAVHRPGIPLDTQLGMIPLRGDHEREEGRIPAGRGSAGRP